jgi:tRNA (guanine-N7-)-methyltransferase
MTAIRTFHPRRGRLSGRHHDALGRLLPRYGVADGGAPIRSRRPLVLEIGFGMGEATAAMAAADPDRDYLGVEIHTPGIANLLALVEERGLGNVQVARADAVELVRDRLAPGSLDAIHVFFPDPWPKARHHKRRLIQPGHVALLVDRLRRGGTLHCATDDAGYAAAMRATLDGAPDLAEGAAPDLAEGAAPDLAEGGAPDLAAGGPRARPVTKFEQRAIDSGRPVFDLVYRKR